MHWFTVESVKPVDPVRFLKPWKQVLYWDQWFVFEFEIDLTLVGFEIVYMPSNWKRHNAFWGLYIYIL